MPTNIITMFPESTDKSATPLAINSAEQPVAVTCSTCQACCCRLEVMLITETGVPDEYIDNDSWGGEVMLRLDDGWCAALDRDTMMCSIYEKRPLICREFEMADYECIIERKKYLPE
ncbi:MAG: YkgJ family cysteine cluster protein [Shewanella psychromarinicola]|jgi:Fe-S-cluster containining protein|uniref:YkgJ family cysteine cluster protein n=1 Tax=Shewanella TaxID=22 RepID=UPI0018E3C71F|nr:YkgJ family cysteine cluster protein [Shewanella sp. Actino-trap-3]|tara:strand:- start:118966 stop:119316 length:351 start_codon:yes stop_codon:yes gene_type:complete